MSKRSHQRVGIPSISIFVFLCLAACQQPTTVQRSPLSPPFSPSIEVGDTLYLSGQVGLNAKTKELAVGIEAETKVTMKNLQRELQAKGYSFADVVATHVWMTDLNEIVKMSKVYRSFLEDNKLPTRTTVEISKLAVGASVEIAMVAVRGQKKYIYPEGTIPGGAPFSPGVLVGDRLFLSGQAGVIPGTLKLVEGNFRAHVIQTLKNIKTVLKAAEMDFSNIVSTEVFMTSEEQFSSMNEVYVSMVPDPKPARIPILVSAIPLGSPVEITMVASRKVKRASIPEAMGKSSAYSRGLKVGNTMHISGVFSSKETIGEGVTDCLERVKRICQSGGFSENEIVEARVYLESLNDYDDMNLAYRKYFPDAPPTRATMEVPDLPGTNKIGMAFVAVKPTQ